jgi:hypothetical protein
MIRFYQAANLPDAYLLVDLLEHAGIASQVFNQNAQAGVGELPFTHAYPEIWLEHRHDVPVARKIVDEFERSEADVGTVNCGYCDEPNPGNFELCWSCGASL